jgi:hypothetical protein|uniref:Uncharacterized protein n=1 Tax=uncultured marine bacterium 582 TaxID=257402 RepID=Q6SEX5_9BACT|nr:hypothetical protein MBMO_EBAC080-L028H02.112 [uncultured marine bacterium 582]|tara:strand:- start:155 stop:325 length:171 start_codon:yes stop_codon:yes gene_type:complete
MLFLNLGGAHFFVFGPRFVKAVAIFSMAARFQVLIWFACTPYIFDSSPNVISLRIA